LQLCPERFSNKMLVVDKERIIKQLLEILGDRPVIGKAVSKANRIKRVKERKPCIRCKSTVKSTKHHITYEPELVVVLCDDCHSRITYINTVGAYATGISRTKEGNSVDVNRLRAKLWLWFRYYDGVLNKKVIVSFLAKTYKIMPECSIKFSKLARRWTKKK
jgi:hypothetical protein